MKFAKKLEKLTDGMNKSQLSRDAGLKSTAISNYINQQGTIPRADIAVQIARVLKVPVDWLVDDSQDFPAPGRGVDLAAFSTNELITEAAKRYLDLALQYRAIVEELYDADWVGICIQLCQASLDDDPPDDIAQLIGKYESIVELRDIERRISTFDIVGRAGQILLSREGGVVIRDDIMLSVMDQQVRELVNKAGAVRHACHLLYHWRELRMNPKVRKSIEKRRAQMFESLKGLDSQSRPGHTDLTK